MAGPRDFTHTFAVAGTRSFGVAGRYLHVMRAPSAPLFITLDDGSELERIAGEGLYVGEGFKLFSIRSAVAQTIRLMVAEEPQVTGGGAGTTASLPTTTQEAPSTTIVSPVQVVLAAATTNATAVPQNLGRRRITIGVLASALVPVRVRAPSVALSGIEIQPGTYEEFRTTAALEIRNDDAANATTFYTLEET